MNLFNKTNAGYLMALAAGQFLVALMLGESIAPGYSMHDNAISDLGTIAETELLFNASLFLIGLLNLLAGYVLYKAIGDRKVLIVFALGGIGAMGAGLVPLDSPIGIHGLFALFASSSSTRKRWSPEGWPSSHWIRYLCCWASWA
jgi:hypothetical membrane protein